MRIVYHCFTPQFCNLPHVKNKPAIFTTSWICDGAPSANKSPIPSLAKNYPYLHPCVSHILHRGFISWIGVPVRTSIEWSWVLVPFRVRFFLRLLCRLPVVSWARERRTRKMHANAWDAEKTRRKRGSFPRVAHPPSLVLASLQH